MAKSFDDLVQRTTTQKTQPKAVRPAQDLHGELVLSEVRPPAGKSQQEVAAALGMKQPSLSKLEKQADMQISTLRKIVTDWGASWRFWPSFRRGPSKSTNSTAPIFDPGASGRENCNCFNHRAINTETTSRR